MINFTHQLLQGLVRAFQPSFRRKLGLITLCTAFIHPFGVQSLRAAETLPPNNVPVATTDVFTINEDTQLNGNVLTNDHDPDGDAIHTKAETINTAHGTVVLKEDGTF